MEDGRGGGGVGGRRQGRRSVRESGGEWGRECLGIPVVWFEWERDPTLPHGVLVGTERVFRGNSADFYCDNILTYYSEFKAAAIKNE